MGKERKLRVLWVSHRSQIGGAELCLWEGVKGLVARGMDVHVILPSEGPLRERLHSVGASTSIVSLPWWLCPPNASPKRARLLAMNFKSSFHLARALHTLRPDVVITNTLVIPTPAWVSKLMGIPHVWYIHEFGDLDHGLRFIFGHRPSIAYLRFFSEIVIVNSQAVKHHFQSRIPSLRPQLVYYAVETPAVDVEVNREDVCELRTVLVGTKAPGKRQEDAIRALSILRQKGLNINLTLVGPEPRPSYANSLRMLAQELHVDNRIIFVGQTDDPLHYVRNADVALMCSHNEAFGRVTIEAMKLGKPVVGAASGGTIELIKNGWNGLLYQPADAQDLATKIELLWNDRDLLQRLGENARTWSRAHFTLERYASGLISILESARKPSQTS